MGRPYFQYTLGSLSNLKNGYITLGEGKIHRINDANLFYMALGYTDAIKKSGLGTEEFIWEEYRKDGSRKNKICLQVKIIEYLCRYSSTCKEQFAVEMAYWLASCNEQWSSNSTVCKNCSCSDSNDSDV